MTAPKPRKLIRKSGRKPILVKDRVLDVNVAIETGGVNIQTEKFRVIVQTARKDGPLVRLHRKNLKRDGKNDAQIDVSKRGLKLRSVYQNGELVRIDAGKTMIVVEPTRCNGGLVFVYDFKPGNGLGELIGKITR